MAHLEITLKVAKHNRTAAAGVYTKYRETFLTQVKGAQSRSCLSETKYKSSIVSILSTMPVLRGQQFVHTGRRRCAAAVPAGGLPMFVYTKPCKNVGVDLGQSYIRETVQDEN